MLIDPWLSMPYAAQNTLLRCSNSAQDLGGLSVGAMGLSSSWGLSSRWSPMMVTSLTVLAELMAALVKSAQHASLVATSAQACAWYRVRKCSPWPWNELSNGSSGRCLDGN